MKTLDYDNPRYPVILDHAEKWVQANFDRIPTAIWEALVATNPNKEILTLHASPRKLCPKCGNEVSYLSARKGKRLRAWECQTTPDCHETNHTSKRGWHDLDNGYPVSGFPGACGVTWCTTREDVAEIACEFGFYVWTSELTEGFVLSVDGGGYDFYMEHWIPLYLGLGCNAHVRDPRWTKVQGE